MSSKIRTYRITGKSINTGCSFFREEKCTLEKVVAIYESMIDEGHKELELSVIEQKVLLSA